MFFGLYRRIIEGEQLCKGCLRLYPLNLLWAIPAKGFETLPRKSSHNSVYSNCFVISKLFKVFIWQIIEIGNAIKTQLFG